MVRRVFYMVRIFNTEQFSISQNFIFLCIIYLDPPDFVLYRYHCEPYDIGKVSKMHLYNIVLSVFKCYYV